MQRTFEQRIDAIARAMDAVGIPYEKRPIWTGYQLLFPWCDGDVACHSGTYGSQEDEVETYQFPWDLDDVSCLTTEEVVANIVAYYNK